MMSQPSDWENPYAGGMEAGSTSENLPTSIPHTLGILNIVFGVVLLLCISCYGMQVLMYGMLGSTVMANPQQFEKAMNEQREREIDALDEAADNAETEEQAEEFRNQRDALSRMPTPKIPDMSNVMGMKTPGVLPAYLFDCLTGFILNVLLLISGIGLVKYRAWARKLALWVAGLKVLRLMIICVLTVYLVAPALSEGMGDLVGEATKINPQAPPPKQMQVDQVKQAYYWMTVVWGICLLVFGVIYPLICLNLLRKPNVIAACQKEKLPPASF